MGLGFFAIKSETDITVAGFGEGVEGLGGCGGERDAFVRGTEDDVEAWVAGVWGAYLGEVVVEGLRVGVREGGYQFGGAEEAAVEEVGGLPPGFEGEGAEG